jgi:RNA polymerase sigma-70 factor (ECF subfamily)
LTEKEIITACKKGQEHGYRALLSQYSSKLLGICIRYLKDREQAKDTLQEVFILIFKNVHKYEDKGSFEGWLCRIAVNCSLKELRSKNKNILQIDESAMTHDLKIEPTALVDMNVDAILHLMNSLPEHYRIVLNLSIVEGYETKEIAEMLSIAENVCRVKLSRARKLLAEVFDKKKEYELSRT